MVLDDVSELAGTAWETPHCCRFVRGWMMMQSEGKLVRKYHISSYNHILCINGVDYSRLSCHIQLLGMLPSSTQQYPTHTTYKTYTTWERIHRYITLRGGRQWERITYLVCSMWIHLILRILHIACFYGRASLTRHYSNENREESTGSIRNMYEY